jgi:two-component system, OmpR family, sensor histidine kinase CiaH
VIMFEQARIKLAIIYTLLFLWLFWALSFGLYRWMQYSLGDGYISMVKQIHGQNQNLGIFDENKATVVIIASKVALSNLKNILFIINAILLLVVPVLGWFLTKKTLDPIQNNHEIQKRFVSDASHELRTPLSILSGEMEIALSKPRTTLDYKNIIKSSKEEIDRMTMLVKNLLFLAKTDYTKDKLHFSQVDVTDLLNSIISEYHLKIKQKNISVDFEPAEISTTIPGQPMLLGQLFSNLIDNAIKYSKFKGKITISEIYQNHYLKINFKDNGLGINPKDKEKIFDRFYRVDQSRSQEKGYGLGLSICKSIVDIHKGKLTVDSVLGKGTSFAVYLPRI